MAVPNRDIRAAAEFVCHWFDRAPVRRKLFLYLVDEKLAGRTPTERSIAADLWAKGPEEFLPSVDSKVRKQKTELKNALEEYYDGPGKADRIRFTLDGYKIVVTSEKVSSEVALLGLGNTSPTSTRDSPSTPFPADPQPPPPETPIDAQFAARQWFEQACGAARLKDDTRTLHCLQNAADSGHPAAMTHLGIMYRQGVGGLPRDDVKAAQWLRKAADKGETRAMYELGVMCERGQGEAAMQPAPMAEDDSVLKAVVKTVSAIAARTIFSRPVRSTNKPKGAGAALEDDGDIKSAFPDDQPALNWIQEAADLGDPFALTFVGTMHFDGFGVPKDEARAAHYFLKAAPHGELFALIALAAMYFTGRGGLQEDHTRGHDHLTQSDIIANAERLNIFERTNQVFLNNNDMYAARWFRKALDHEPRAMSRLGAMYAGGRTGLSRDDERAVYWFRKAANASDPLGMACFGVMNANGRGGLPQNKIYAAHWFRRAADAGEALGIVGLAIMLGNRHDGPSQDEAQALKWLRASGLPEAYALVALDYVTGGFAPHACTRLLRTSLMFTR